MAEKKEPKFLPKRCKTCGGKGYLDIPQDGSGKTQKETCPDCIAGIAGYVVIND